MRKQQTAADRRKLFHKIIHKPKHDGRPWAFSADILDFAGFNKGKKMLNFGFRYLITCIDNFSRYAFAFPMKQKTTESIWNSGFIKLLKKERPFNLNFDRESGIKSKKITAFLKQNDIKLWHAEPFQPNKNKLNTALIERWHRTLNGMLERSQVAFKDKKVLQLSLIHI